MTDPHRPDLRPFQRFEWDEAKRARNLQKHGIDFEDATDVWSGRVMERLSASRGSEERWITVGLLDGRVVAVVWTSRGINRRIISVRVARRNEREDYAAQAR